MCLAKNPPSNSLKKKKKAHRGWKHWLIILESISQYYLSQPRSVLVTAWLEVWARCPSFIFTVVREPFLSQGPPITHYHHPDHPPVFPHATHAGHPPTDTQTPSASGWCRLQEHCSKWLLYMLGISQNKSVSLSGEQSMELTTRQTFIEHLLCVRHRWM